jgi:fluoride exporter
MARTSPVDPDVEVPTSARRTPGRLDPAVVAVIALGGVLGAEARYALGLALPHAPGSWPLGTLLINVSGSLALGALMVVVTELTSPHRLLRPFLGVGVLGGYTTFSTAEVDVAQMLRAGRPLLATGYLVGTALAALLAAWLGTTLARTAAAGWGRRRARRARRGRRERR